MPANAVSLTALSTTLLRSDMSFNLQVVSDSLSLEIWDHFKKTLVPPEVFAQPAEWLPIQLTEWKGGCHQLPGCCSFTITGCELGRLSNCVQNKITPIDNRNKYSWKLVAIISCRAAALLHFAFILQNLSPQWLSLIMDATQPHSRKTLVALFQLLPKVATDLSFWKSTLSFCWKLSGNVKRYYSSAALIWHWFGFVKDFLPTKVQAVGWK